MKEGGEYLIDRVSLETFLAKKQEPKIAAATKLEQSAAVTASSQPAQVPATFPIPSELLAGIDAVVKQPEQMPSQTPLPSSGNTKPPFDLQAGPKAVVASEGGSGEAAVQKRRQPPSDSKPPASVAAGQSAQGNASVKRRRSDERHGAEKKYRKGPVHYAKDGMRQLTLAQLRDVRDWILMRMDQRMRPL